MKLLALALALAAGVRFENVGPQAGFTQAIPNGGDRSKQFIIETTGSGVGFIDYDNDGLLDAFVASGPGSPSRLYHNKGGGKFEDVTDAMGLKQTGWAQGVCAGDYDNDGFTDLFVTYWGGNHLYRNVGGRAFEDVTVQAHLTQDRTRYNTGCAFLDYDNDGHLDLFVANYLKFDPKTTPKPGDNPYCFYREMAVNCGPRGLPFDRNLLYHNDGHGVFTDVSVESGIAGPHQNYALGVLTGDFNHDGLMDIYVACDQTPSLLYINQGNGKFEEEGLLRGVAFDSNGKALSGMGVTAADYDLSGALAIFRTNFSDERETLYRAQNRRGEFEDVTIAAGLSRNTRFVGWGCGFFDFDNDGFKDLLIVNGHVFPEVDRLKLDIHYKERAILYRNLGNGKFEDISETAGPGILEAHSARGAAFGDLENNGRVAVLVNNQNEPPSLLKPGGGNANHWVTLKLTGTKANRSAIGARVTLTAGGRTQMDEVRSGGSYLSQNDLRLHFGLGTATRVDTVEIEWPGGLHQVERMVPVDRVVSITEASPVKQAAHALRDALDAGNFASGLASGLEASALLKPVMPSLSLELYERALAAAPNVTERFNAQIRFHLDLDEVTAAIEAARAAKNARQIAIPGVQELLDWLAANRPGAGADLFRELLAGLPPALVKTTDLMFVLRNLKAVAGTDPELAALAAERILGSVEARDFRPVESAPVPGVFGKIATANTRDTMLFAAGMVESALDPRRFAWHAEALAPWRAALQAKNLRAIELAWPRVDRPARGAPVRELGVLRQTLEAALEEAFGLRAHRGKPLLVAFWATWCPPCKREMPWLSRLARGGAATVIGVSDEPEATVDAYTKAHGLALRNVWDPGQRLHDEFEVVSLPALLVFDGEGHLVGRSQ